jgi:hypothetical protein
MVPVLAMLIKIIKHIMLTSLLFLALLISCWVIFKTIDWFEKI